MVATAIVGFAGGIRIVSWLSVLAGLAVALPSLFVVSYRGVAGSSFQFAIEVVLVGVVGGFSRLVIDNARQTSEGLSARPSICPRSTTCCSTFTGPRPASQPRSTSRGPPVGPSSDWTNFTPDIAAVVLRDPVTGLVAHRGRQGRPGDRVRGVPRPTQGASHGVLVPNRSPWRHWNRG